MMIPYNIIDCCCFIEHLSVTNMIFKRFLHFLNQCISHKENNMLKLLDKSEKDIDKQGIALKCLGGLQTGPRN